MALPRQKALRPPADLRELRSRHGSLGTGYRLAAPQDSRASGTTSRGRHRVCPCPGPQRRQHGYPDPCRTMIVLATIDHRTISSTAISARAVSPLILLGARAGLLRQPLGPTSLGALVVMPVPAGQSF